MALQLYAELLTNIRKVSVTVELPTPSNESTSIAVKDGIFTLYHNDTEGELKLPGDIDPAYVAPKPTTGLQQISCRIPLASQISQPRAIFESAATAPWSATDLSSGDEFACRKCGATVLAKDTIKAWQDLPSANWAEMMDFWHCHKPTVPKTNGTAGEADNKLEEKGYGASTSFKAQKGIGKVDLMDFLLAEEDMGSAVVSFFFYSPSVSL